MQEAGPLPISELFLGEDLFKDLLRPTRLSPEEVEKNTRYMAELVEHMRATGRAPDSERIDVNEENIVVGGNHRVLAAWLLKWTHIHCLRCDYKAGWKVNLDEAERGPMEALLGLSP